MELIHYLIVLFGTVNLVRIGLFIIGADLYDLKSSKKKKKESMKGSYPFFTVVIPVHNEQNTIIRGVKSVLKNDYPNNKLRIVVVDDGSTDNSKSIVKNFIKERKLKNVIL